jgi:hypothetical protein
MTRPLQARICAALETSDSPCSTEGFLAKWRRQSDWMKRRRALVDGASLCDEILRDFESSFAVHANEALNLQEAAEESGFSSDHLGRLVRDGKIPNAGRPNAPRIRRADLPRKPASGLRPARSSPKLLGATPGQIARDIVEGASR